MTKLRVVEERSSEALEASDGENNLRGLGDAELFMGSGLDVHLIVRNPPPHESVKSIADAYGLHFRHDESDGHAVHFHALWRLPGEHKKQAIKVFFAALEIHHKFSAARCLITERSELRSLLADRIGNAKTETDQNREWVQGRARFTVDASITHYLHQAGFMVQPSETRVELDRETLEKVGAPVHAPRQTFRKVGG